MAGGLEQAIASAAEQITKEGKQLNGTTPAVPPVETQEEPEETQVPEESPEDQGEEEQEGSEESEESVETTEEEEEKLSEQELAEAKFIYSALKKPDMRGPVLQALLQQTEVPVETKKEQTVAKKTIAAMIEEALGPDFAFLTKKLGPAIEQAIQTEAQQIREENAQTAREAEVNRVNKEVVDEMAILSKETKGDSKKLEAQMAKLSEVILPGPNATIHSYLRVLYREASAGNQTKKVQAQITDKIKRNAVDAPSRLASTATPRLRQSEITGPPNKRMGLNDSVKWAMEQLGKTPPKKGK